MMEPLSPSPNGGRKRTHSIQSEWTGMNMGDQYSMMTDMAYSSGELDMRRLPVTAAPAWIENTRNGHHRQKDAGNASHHWHQGKGDK